MKLFLIVTRAANAIATVLCVFASLSHRMKWGEISFQPTIIHCRDLETTKRVRGQLICDISSFLCVLYSRQKDDLHLARNRTNEK